MKVTILTLFFTASVFAQKQKVSNSNSLLTESKQTTGQRNLQDDQSFMKKKLRGSALSSKTTSESQNEEVHNEADLKNLTAVIHIGPMKTGSSAIQASFGTVYSTLRGVDNYEASGKVLDYGIKDFHMIGCFRSDAVPFTGKLEHFEISCFPNALQQVLGVAKRNHSLIITAEYLTHPNTDLKKFKEFLSPWKNHRIVAYYRRYYDWLLSFHNQIYKEHDSPLSRKSLPEFLQKEMNDNYFYDAMYLTKAIERYQNAGFHDVKVINIYDLPTPDVREPFYCSGLVNATATCNKFREYVKTEEPEVENPSVPLVYNELAYYAKEMNLWNDDEEKSLDVNSVSKLAQAHHNNRRKLQNKMTYDSSAYICPQPEVYKWLLETSLSIEKELFPEYFAMKGEREIIEHFNSLVDAKKFCHIDAQLLLQNDQEWILFFQALSPVTNK